MVENLHTDDKLDYKILIEKTVCDAQSKDCMFHKCKDCPGKEALKVFLENQMNDHYDDSVSVNQLE